LGPIELTGGNFECGSIEDHQDLEIDDFGSRRSYRRILVTEGIRRQRFELAI